VLVLGTAQDGGLPQIACDCSHCRAARSDSSRARFVTSILLVDPRTNSCWLFDATPDLPRQIQLARNLGVSRAASPGRPALFEGIFLTHAHMGHYTGLLHLGREAYGSEPTPVHLSPRFAEFLRGNGPWDQLVSEQRIILQEFEFGTEIALAPDLSVTALAVPHRDEYSDTCAFRIDGPSASLLYLPDIDKWELWEHSIEAELARSTVALVDGTFYSGDELSGRDMSSIPHPSVCESMQRFEDLPAQLRERVFFTHLNHSNPLVDPASPAAVRVWALGFKIARQGARFGL
jgi:pyrroloquinoline quinone biosynthesis protein B